MKDETTHSVPPGPMLSDKMRDKLDDAYKAYADRWPHGKKSGEAEWNRSFGRVEGCAAQLGILRGTSTKEEIELARERYDV